MFKFSHFVWLLSEIWNKRHKQYLERKSCHFPSYILLWWSPVSVPLRVFWYTFQKSLEILQDDCISFLFFTSLDKKTVRITWSVVANKADEPLKLSLFKKHLPHPLAPNSQNQHNRWNKLCVKCKRDNSLSDLIRFVWIKLRHVIDSIVTVCLQCCLYFILLGFFLFSNLSRYFWRAKIE